MNYTFVKLHPAAGLYSTGGFGFFHQRCFFKVQLRWKCNTEAHVNAGTVAACYWFLEKPVLSPVCQCLQGSGQRTPVLHTHARSDTQTCYCPRRYGNVFPTPTSTNQPCQRRLWKWTTAATSHSCPPDEIHLFHSQTPGLPIPHSVNIFCLF